MATYRQRKISPINFEYIGMDGRKYNKRLTSIADDMEALSDQGYYQYNIWTTGNWLVYANSMM